MEYVLHFLVMQWMGKNESMLVMDAGQGMGYVHSSRRSAANWQTIKSSIALNVPIFHVMH